MSQLCPICRKKGKHIRNHVKGGIAINVYRCDDCFMDYLEHWDDEERVYRFYDGLRYVYKPNVSGEKMKFNEYEHRLERIRPFLSKNSRLLDIGCGEGTFLRMIRPYCGTVEGTEITNVHVEKLRQEGFKIWKGLLHEIQPEVPYDVICMFALLEHIPKVIEFLDDLKTRFMYEKTQVFIETPNLLDPLTSCFDVKAYRDFFYREYHLYNFTEKSMGRLLGKAGFQCETQPLLQASITNHFHWMYTGQGQPTTTDMSNVVLPVPPLMEKTPTGKSFAEILDETDDFYRNILMESGIGDLIACRAWL